MKNVRKMNQSGFSLVELMIVVAIIGILATIAVPNFQRFQAKARQSETKTNLSALYTAEKAFHAEWNQYWGDFRDVGMRPEGQLRYHFGFAAAGTNPATVNPTFIPSTVGGAAGAAFNTGVAAALGTPATATVIGGTPAFAAAPANGATCAAGANPAGVGTAATFRASSIGNIGTSGTNDQWTINQTKVLCNNTVGIN